MFCAWPPLYGYLMILAQTMVIAAVIVVNAFHGISTSAWTGWVWFAVTIGVILIWVYTVRPIIFLIVVCVLTVYIGCVFCDSSV